MQDGVRLSDVSQPPTAEEETLYEKKKLDLIALLGGDTVGRCIRDTQLPDGTFPAPCPHTSYEANLPRLPPRSERESLEADRALAAERVEQYLRGVDKFQRRAQHLTLDPLLMNPYVPPGVAPFETLYACAGSPTHDRSALPLTMHTYLPPDDHHFADITQAQDDNYRRKQVIMKYAL
ncbi:hypothetical protein DIPPA_06242 [Diplonema papillatum]|nr:hypothetical protein DIPPA_06242 [Diplonema papillatum]